MQRLFYIIMAGVVTFALSGCTDKVPGQPDKPAGVTPNVFQISTSGSTFADKGFSNGDVIGMYIVQKSSQSAGGALGSTGNLFDNKKFVYTSGVMNADVAHVYPSGVEWVDMYGYSPYSAAGISSANKLSFTVQADQSSSLTKSDLLWVAKSAVQTTAATPELVFLHKLSKVIVKLTGGVGVTLATPTVTVNNTLGSVELDMVTGELGVASVVLPSISLFSTASATEFHAIVVPQRVTNLPNFITITNGGKVYNYTLDAAKDFISGKIYSYDITVNADNLSVKISGSVTDWGTGDTTTGDAE